ncbi:MAG: tetratricopeptide repeat protein [Myxococcota bacterium]
MFNAFTSAKRIHYVTRMKWIICGLLLHVALCGYVIKRKKVPLADPTPYLLWIQQTLAQGRIQAAKKLWNSAQQCHKQKTCFFPAIQDDFVQGILHLQQKQHTKAIRSLRRVLNQRSSSTRKVRPKKHATHRTRISAQDLQQYTFFYLGQAYFAQKAYAKAAGAFQKSGTLGHPQSGFFILWARAHRANAKHHAALQVLSQGLQKHAQPELLQEYAYTLIEMNLWQAAIHIAMQLQDTSPTHSQHILLRLTQHAQQKRHPQHALQTLEMLCQMFPHHVRFRQNLARAYLQQQHPYSAAQLLQNISKRNAQTPYWTAHALLQKKLFRQALLWNQRISSTRTRLLQRTEIYLQMGHMQLALLCLKQLQQQRQLPGKARYLFAYTALATGHFQLAEQQLQQLRTTQWNTQAQNLREILKHCRKKPWQCLHKQTRQRH